MNEFKLYKFDQSVGEPCINGKAQYSVTKLELVISNSFIAISNATSWVASLTICSGLFAWTGLTNFTLFLDELF